MARHPSVSTLMHRLFGKARGWETLRFGWGHVRGDFPREGWWAITPDGQVYLAASVEELYRKFAKNPLYSR